MNYKAIVFRFFIEGLLEIGLAAAITISRMTKENFDQFMEAVSTASAFVFTAICVTMPIFLLVAAKRFKRDIALGKKKESWYREFFDEDIREKRPGAFYYV